MSFFVGDLIGVVLAMISAVAFAIYYLCVRLGTEKGSIFDVMLVSLLFNAIIILPLVGVVHGIPQASTASILAFIAAGISGSFLARLTLAKSIEMIGASRTSPIAASNVFFASLLAVILFGERLTMPHFLGIVLIVVGVVVISWETSHDATPKASFRELGLALLLPVFGAMLWAFEPIFISFGLSAGSTVLTGMAIKVVAATIGLVFYLQLRDLLRADIFRWTPSMKWHLGAGLTSTIGLLSFFAALETSRVVLVVPLLQTSPLVVMVLSAIFLPNRLERITHRLLSGATVVVAGAILVSAYG